jgi:hypothetical protein
MRFIAARGESAWSISRTISAQRRSGALSPPSAGTAAASSALARGLIRCCESAQAPESTVFYFARCFCTFVRQLEAEGSISFSSTDFSWLPFSRSFGGQYAAESSPIFGAGPQASRSIADSIDLA